MAFGEYIRELRRARGLSLRTLATDVGVDFTYLSKVETGKVEYTPSEETISALAKALEVDEIDLLRLAGKVPPALEPLARSSAARTFLRRAKELNSADDWNDLLRFLDRRQAEKEAGRGKK